MVPKPDVSESNRLQSAAIDAAADGDAAALLNGEVELEEDDGFIESDGEIEPAVEFSEDDELLILSPLSDEFDEKVAEAQEQLLHLRHQQEQLEKQKAQLEELKRKREKFLRGRAEATDRLTKATAMLQREMFEAQKRLDQCGHVRERFDHHLERRSGRTSGAETIWATSCRTPWQRSKRRAMNTLQKWRGSVLWLTWRHRKPWQRRCRSRSRLRLTRWPPLRRPPPSHRWLRHRPRDFMYWLKSGFAFTLPLLIFGIFALFLVLAIF